MNVSELIETLKLLPTSSNKDVVKIVVNAKGESICRHSSVDIEGIHVGIDWDRGNVFVNPETPLGVSGDAMEAERKRYRNNIESLILIRGILTGSISDGDKLSRIHQILDR